MPPAVNVLPDIVIQCFSVEEGFTEKDRVFGCLFGLAVGDALGAPLEGLPREEIASRFGQVTEMQGGGWLHLKPGEFTDDTEMALRVAEALAKAGRVDLDTIAAEFMDWLKSQPKDVGGQTHAAIRALQEGVPPTEAGRKVWEDGGSWLAGNGAVMRTAPIGLFCRNESFETRANHSRQVAAITHGDPRCQEAAALIDHAVANLSCGYPVRHRDLLNWARARSEPLRQRVDEIPRLEWEQLRTGGFVLDTTQTALWHLMKAESFKEGLISAVNLGHDADTTGAVTGALLGARFGMGSIPQRWLHPLSQYERIERAAQFLYGAGAGTAD